MKFANRFTFEQYLNRFGKTDYVELVNGQAIEKPLVELDEQKLFVWLLCIVGGITEAKVAGMVLGPRTPVRISECGGRLPDLLFVREDNFAIVGQKGIRGTPDIVM